MTQGNNNDVVVTSMEAAGNYLAEQKKEAKSKIVFEDKAGSGGEFVDYAMQFMTKENLPFSSIESIRRNKAVLGIMGMGYTYEAIATWLKNNGHGNVSVKKVKQYEKDGIKMCKDAIARMKSRAVPIVGGK